MSANVAVDPLAGFLPQSQLPALLQALQEAGYRCVGPQERDGAIVFDELHSTEDLPWGRIDEQRPGHYRLHDDIRGHAFAYATGPQAVKPMVFQPRETLWTTAKDATGHLRFEAVRRNPTPTAIIGIHACDLSALALQDAHFSGCRERDPAYLAQRDHLLLIAVHCSRSAATCFCASTGDGPAIQRGADLTLGELDDGLIISAATNAGRRICRLLPLVRVRPEQWAELRRKVADNGSTQQRRLPDHDLRPLLYDRLDSPHWQQIANRCLSCGNCTAVCPTCFCFHEFDVASADGTHSDHVREWDSCFSTDHGHLAGLEVRGEERLRYRQWLLHKLGTWHEQYGRSGCVGCGRCITWCPVGIDLTAEVAALAAEAPCA